MTAPKSKKSTKKPTKNNDPINIDDIDIDDIEEAKPIDFAGILKKATSLLSLVNQGMRFAKLVSGKKK